jgi:hypothetical protein
VKELHPQLVQVAPVLFTARPNQIVQSNDFKSADVFEQSVG